MSRGHTHSRIAHEGITVATAAVISFIVSPTTVAVTAYCGGCDTAAMIKETACADVVNSTSVEIM